MIRWYSMKQNHIESNRARASSGDVIFARALSIRSYHLNSSRSLALICIDEMPYWILSRGLSISFIRHGIPHKSRMLTISCETENGDVRGHNYRTFSKFNLSFEIVATKGKHRDIPNWTFVGRKYFLLSMNVKLMALFPRWLHLVLWVRWEKRRTECKHGTNRQLIE